MRIKKILNQNGRHFTAILECEHCGGTIKQHCHDHVHFHLTVIPNMECIKCKKKAPDAHRPLTTKYEEGQNV